MICNESVLSHPHCPHQPFITSLISLDDVVPLQLSRLFTVTPLSLPQHWLYHWKESLFNYNGEVWAWSPCCWLALVPPVDFFVALRRIQQLTGAVLIFEVIKYTVQSKVWTNIIHFLLLPHFRIIVKSLNM